MPYRDIVEGVPEERFYSENDVPAGAVLIRRGTPRGPSRRPIVITQNSPGVPGHSSPGDAFGTAIAVGRLGPDRYADLVIGAANDRQLDVRRNPRRVSGRVTVLRGGPDGYRRQGGATFDRDRG